jgi:hypothetical protein
MRDVAFIRIFAVRMNEILFSGSFVSFHLELFFFIIKKKKCGRFSKTHSFLLRWGGRKGREVTGP